MSPTGDFWISHVGDVGDVGGFHYEIMFCGNVRFFPIKYLGMKTTDITDIPDIHFLRLNG